MDLFSRRIVGLDISGRMKDDLVISALQQAFLHRQPDTGLIHHSDRGNQYTSKDYRDLLVKYCIVASMSGSDNCYDNAVIESFFHILKTEHIYFEQYETHEQAMSSCWRTSFWKKCLRG